MNWEDRCERAEYDLRLANDNLAAARTQLAEAIRERDGMRLSIDARHTLLSVVTREREQLRDLLRSAHRVIHGASETVALHNAIDAALAPPSEAGA